MKDTMNYKGYKARVTFDPDDKAFHGIVVNIEDTVHFEGQSVTELTRAFKDSVDYYLEFCRKRGQEPDKPYSGRLLVRLSPDVHREIAHAAKLSGTSVNTFVAQVLSDAARPPTGKTAR
jgi:predicted HicB family RNase H-like nuclease